jgi:2-desacetyl-2-hydroxyethyl bacteriochlorophyllide A dehydrogenase
MIMRAAIMHAPHAMSVGSWETPHAAAGEILVSVAAAGICAGDMYFYLGKNPYAVYPQICGHEIAGVVAALGEGVTDPAVGTPVVVEPFLGCGHCYPCRVGKSNCCDNLRIIGVHQPGGYADSVVAPATHIHTVPVGLDLFTATFAEPVAIGVQACRRGNVQAGEDVLILGCGPIGLALVEVVLARGAHPIVTDVLPERLATAAQLGAETLPAGEQLLAQVLARTHGEGMPVVIEATGNPKAMEQTVDLVAAGGRIVIVGLLKQGVNVSFPGLDFTRKEITVVGSRASVNCFPEALSLLAEGKIHYPKIATALSLWDAPAVFADLAEEPGKVHKAVLVHDQNL